MATKDRRISDMQREILMGIIDGTTQIPTTASITLTDNDVQIVDAAGDALIGQKTKAGSLPVTLASDEDDLGVTNTVLTDIHDDSNNCIGVKDVNTTALGHGGGQTVSVPGTAVALTASSTPCQAVLVKVNVAGDGDFVYIGDSSVDDTDVGLPDATILVIPCTNANAVYIDADTASDGVDWQPIA